MNKHFDVHVCMVSDQAIPNFVPVLDRDFRPKKVILLVTQRMQAKADVLEKVIKKSCGIHDVRQVSLSGEYEMKSIEQEVLDVLAEEDKGSVALNLTGGTKLMAIAAFELFQSLGFESFYFTAASNEVIILGGQGEKFTLQPPKIKIEDYLALYGHPAIGRVCREYQFNKPELWKELIRARNNMGEEVGSLNYAIATSGKDLEIPLPHGKNPQNMDVLIGWFEDAGLVKRKKDKLVFPSLDEKKYVGGGWFEDYVFSVARRLPGVQDCAINIQIENQDKNINQNNELDIVIMKGNGLYILECKTANFASKDGKKEADHALYKLESLKKLGGLKTELAFVSFRDVDRTVRDRAKGAKIELIERKDLGGLETLLGKWSDGNGSK